MLALNYMHLQNVTHRDLKLENLMCVNNDVADLTVKLTDFGFATFFDPKLKMDIALGSPLYMSPELMKEQKYDEKVDVWSLGCITYILLTGTPAFKGQTEDEVKKYIIESEVEYPDELWGDISNEAKDFCIQCLNKNADLRPKVNDLFASAWIKRWIDNPVINEDKLLQVTDALVSFRKIGLLQSGVLSFLTNLLVTADELNELAEIFKQMDQSNDGFLSIEELR